MVKKEIILLLENTLKYKGLKLPKYIDFSIDTGVLSINLGQIGKGCVANMQTDEASFEGWAICLKHHLCNQIDSVALSWKEPAVVLDNEQLHYNRFLYRVIRFRELFNWFMVAESNEPTISAFRNDLTNLSINTALNAASETTDKSSKEKQIEYSNQNLDSIRKELGLSCINHQLPVGVKKNGKCFFTGRGSAIDIWGIDQQHKLNIFELKVENKKVGIITELLFYSEVMYDLFMSKQIHKPQQIKNIRHIEYLYGADATPIKGIKSYFLADKIHPLVAGTTALLNTNKLGIKFYHLQYRLKKDLLLFDKLFFKGGYQLEQEIKQACYRTVNGQSGYSYLLNDSYDNLYADIRNDAVSYFSENDIHWWTYNKAEGRPTGHLLSSQIQCLNFLFALRKDIRAVLKLAQLFDPNITEVLPTLNDVDKGYIAFEFTYKNDVLLNEISEGGRRGTKCTSIDACILACRGARKILIPIEWKYTESYLKDENKALEAGKGVTRQGRYNKLITQSAQLKESTDYSTSAYYREPFYELMRQTLLVEQMTRLGVADDFLHILVVPAANTDFRGAHYAFSDKEMEETWREQLVEQSRFKIMDSCEIFSCICEMQEYKQLSGYLQKRYY